MNVKMTDLALLAASATALYLVMSVKSGKLKINWTPWAKTTSYDGWNYYNDGNSGLAIKYDENGKPAEYWLNGEQIWNNQLY